MLIPPQLFPSEEQLGMPISWRPFQWRPWQRRRCNKRSLFFLCSVMLEESDTPALKTPSLDQISAFDGSSAYLYGQSVGKNWGLVIARGEADRGTEPMLTDVSGGVFIVRRELTFRHWLLIPWQFISKNSIQCGWYIGVSSLWQNHWGIVALILRQRENMVFLHAVLYTCLAPGTTSLIKQAILLETWLVSSSAVDIAPRLAAYIVQYTRDYIE